MDPDQSPLGAREAVNSLLADHRKLAIAAAILMFVSLMAPVAGLHFSFFGFSQTSGISGSAYLGGLGWLTFLLMTAAAISRFPAAGELARYERLLDLVALGCWALTVVLGLFGTSPGNLHEMVSLSPSIGVIPLILSPVALAQATRLRKHPPSSP